jgi:hypothetical protein
MAAAFPSSAFSDNGRLAAGASTLTEAQLSQLAMPTAIQQHA